MNIKAAAKNDVGKMEAAANAKLEPVVAVMASGNERISLDNYANPAGVTPTDYVVAPADRIYSTTPNNTYEQLSGTSMSTPYVSGVAALLVGANPSLSPSEVEMAITRTANPFGIIV